MNDYLINKPFPMTSYTLEEVTSKRAVREFLDLPKKLYANEPNWICPLDQDICARFDPARNELLHDGEAIRWIVLDDKGEVAGRIAAFYNRRLLEKSEGQPTGGCGFFESINDQQVANLLFDAARDWLKERGIEAMDGPINFGDRNQWWGVLTKGFEFTPLYGVPYNFEYYKTLFENYGFENYYNQHTYLREMVVDVFSERIYDRIAKLKADPAYTFKHISKKNMDKFALDFMEIYNQAWAKFTGVAPIDKEHAFALMKEVKPILDEKLMHFAYYNERPIGFFIMMPDLNPVIAPFNGHLNLWNKLRLVWRLKIAKKTDRAIGLIFGVIPEFQGKAIETGMILSFEDILRADPNMPYKTLELMWIGDFNPIMMRVAETIVLARPHKMHTTYRYLFDRTKPFTRAPRMRPVRVQPTRSLSEEEQVD